MPQVLVGLAILSTGVQVMQQRKAALASRRQQRAQQNLQRAESRRTQMQQVARSRALQAQILNTSEQTGATGSAAQGMVASTSSSAADNISFIQTGLLGADYITDQRTEQIKAQSTGDLFGAIGQVSDAFATATDAYKKVFETEPKVVP